LNQVKTFSVSGKIANINLPDMWSIVKDFYIYIKPIVKDNIIDNVNIDNEPLRKIEIIFNDKSFEVDHIMTRRIFPRENYGINDNKELIYYIPVNNTWNFSRIDNLKMRLTFIDDNKYDVVVATKVHNVLRIMNGMAALAYIFN
jgi:hypothetical protein